MKRFPILLLVLVLFVTGVAAGQTRAKDEAVLTSLVNQMTQAQLAYDAAALDRIFTADYIEISPAGEFDPREKVLGFYKPELKPPDTVMATLAVSDVSVRSYGRFAVVIAKFTYEIKVEGKARPPRSMRATFVCRQEKDAWKIASAQYTGIRPPEPPTSKLETKPRN